jgi:hypothetical protein
MKRSVLLILLISANAAITEAQYNLPSSIINFRGVMQKNGSDKLDFDLLAITRSGDCCVGIGMRKRDNINGHNLIAFDIFGFMPIILDKKSPPKKGKLQWHLGMGYGPSFKAEKFSDIAFYGEILVGLGYEIKKWKNNELVLTADLKGETLRNFQKLSAVPMVGLSYRIGSP